MRFEKRRGRETRAERSIEAYRSQLQIAALVDSIRQDGPYEYLRDVHFRLYSSKKYRPLFAE